ncbi:MAG: ECF transporter S component [Mobilitalea sp.]
MNKKKKVLLLTQFAILLAIEVIVCFTPLGSLPVFGPVVATLSHVPVIITAILLGTKAGAGMGFFFGLFSFMVWTFMPPSPIAFVFTPFYSLGEMQGNLWSIMICFIPRILIGIVTGFTYKVFSKRTTNKVISYGISAVLGSLTNTILVLAGIFLFFGHEYAATIGTTYQLIITVFGMTILTNGIPEAVIGGIVSYGICRPMEHINRRA